MLIYANNNTNDDNKTDDDNDKKKKKKKNRSERRDSRFVTISSLQRVCSSGQGAIFADDVCYT